MLKNSNCYLAHNKALIQMKAEDPSVNQFLSNQRIELGIDKVDFELVKPTYDLVCFGKKVVPGCKGKTNVALSSNLLPRMANRMFATPEMNRLFMLHHSNQLLCALFLKKSASMDRPVPASVVNTPNTRALAAAHTLIEAESPALVVLTAWRSELSTWKRTRQQRMSFMLASVKLNETCYVIFRTQKT
jgi:hypothetical protein